MTITNFGQLIPFVFLSMLTHLDEIWIFTRQNGRMTTMMYRLEGTTTHNHDFLGVIVTCIDDRRFSRSIRRRECSSLTDVQRSRSLIYCSEKERRKDWKHSGYSRSQYAIDVCVELGTVTKQTRKRIMSIKTHQVFTLLVRCFNATQPTLAILWQIMLKPVWWQNYTASDRRKTEKDWNHVRWRDRDLFFFHKLVQVTHLLYLL